MFPDVLLTVPFAGDQSHRGGVQAAPAHGLPHRPAPADVGLLAEGAQRPPQVRTDSQHAGQAHPQPQQPQEDGQRELQVSPALPW